MKSELSKLRTELEKRKNRIGLVGTRLNVQEAKGNSFTAHISTDWREIEISYGKDFNAVPDKRTEKFVETRAIKDPYAKIGEDVLEHEAGHRENKVGERTGCPYNIETHELIKDSIAKGLGKVGKKGLEHFVTNAFEDVLDNVNCRRHTDFAGQTLFWNTQGLTNSENGKFNPFYEAFVRVNLTLGDKSPDYAFLKKFFTLNSKVKKAVNSFLGDLRETAQEDKLQALHKREGFKVLFNPQDLRQRAEAWAQLGYSFAVNLGPLLENMPQEQMFGDEGEPNSPDNNPFDREMRMPGNRQKIAMDRYKEGRGPAAHREPQEQLYDLYKAISKDIPVETSHYSASQSMPLVRYGRRFVKEDEQKVKFKGIGFKENGEMGIKTSKHALQHPVAYKVHLHKFPKFKLALVDRSGSMAEDSQGGDNTGDKSFIPWGDKSKYHFALKGYFGIDNFLERQGVAKYVESTALGFSGEAPLRGTGEQVAKGLLVHPKGTTSLDINGLERELEENALVLSLSDGGFSLSDRDKQRFEKKLETCDYAHIQIGGETPFCNYLRGLNIPVAVVNGDEDLSRTMVSFVASYYRDKQQGASK